MKGNDNFPRSTSALLQALPSDNQRVAATVEEGTARKHVSPVNARTQRQSVFKGDSRKDGGKQYHSLNAGGIGGRAGLNATKQTNPLQGRSGDESACCRQHLVNKFRARKGIDSSRAETVAGRGCLVGHVKLRGKTETITSFTWTSVVRTAKSLSRPNCREPRTARCSLGCHLVAASKNPNSGEAGKAGKTAEQATGGGNRQSVALGKPVERLSSNQRTRGFDSRRVHHTTK